MKRRIIIVPVLVLIAAAGWWWLSDDPRTQRHRAAPPEMPVTPKDEISDESVPGNDAEPAAVQAARRRVADAELALRMATAQRKAAEADIQTAEREVEELERWVAEIEARGDDPVDYADEGLEKLQPAFFAYQDASERLELAEEMEITATEEIALANAALSAALASTDTDK